MNNKPHQMTLEDRMRASVQQAAPSLIPGPRDIRPRKVEEVIPDIREMIDSGVDRTKLLRLITTLEMWGEQEREAKKAKEPISAEIKRLLQQYSVKKAMIDGHKINCFTMSRSTIDGPALLSHGVSAKVIAECTVTKEVIALRCTPPGSEEEE